MGRVHLGQDGLGGPGDGDGTLAWGTCRGGAPPPSARKEGSLEPEALVGLHAVSA